MQVLLPRLSRSSRGDKAAAQRERGPADFTQNRNRFTQNLPLQTHVVAGTSYLAMQSRLIRRFEQVDLISKILLKNKRIRSRS